MYNTIVPREIQELVFITKFSFSTSQVYKTKNKSKFLDLLKTVSDYDIIL